MTDEEINSFLMSEPPRPAVLATTRDDGNPHVAPVWYIVDHDRNLVFTTGAETVKGRNLASSGRAAICVHDDRSPYAFASVEGSVLLSEDLLELHRWAAALGGRYMGMDRAEEFGDRNGVEGELLVRLVPEHAVGATNLAD